MTATSLHPEATGIAPVRYEISAPCNGASLAVFEEVLAAFLCEEAGIESRMVGPLRRDAARVCERALARPAHPSRLNVASIAIARSAVRHSPFLEVEITDPGDPTDLLSVVPPFSGALVGWDVPLLGDRQHGVVARVEDEWTVRIVARRPRATYWLGGVSRRWSVVQLRVDRDRGTVFRLGWPRGIENGA